MTSQAKDPSGFLCSCVFGNSVEPCKLREITLTDMTPPVNALSNSLALLHSRHIPRNFLLYVWTIQMSEGVGRPIPRFRGMACARGDSRGFVREFSKPAIGVYIASVAPFRFRLGRAMRALVLPRAGSNIDQITPSLNAASVGCRGSLELSRDK